MNIKPIEHSLIVKSRCFPLLNFCLVDWWHSDYLGAGARNVSLRSLLISFHLGTVKMHMWWFLCWPILQTTLLQMQAIFYRFVVVMQQNGKKSKGCKIHFMSPVWICKCKSYTLRLPSLDGLERLAGTDTETCGCFGPGTARQLIKMSAHVEGKSMLHALILLI